MDPFVGEIRLMAFSFAPKDWAICNGQLIPIQQNTALFSILGTSYGGNGTTTFALPNLNGRTPVGTGQGQGISQYLLGESGGTESVTLLTTEMPTHGHALKGTAGVGSANLLPSSPAVLAASSMRSNLYSTAQPDVTMASPVAVAGGSVPHNNMPPYLGMNFYISLRGMFPSRN